MSKLKSVPKIKTFKVRVKHRIFNNFWVIKNANNELTQSEPHQDITDASELTQSEPHQDITDASELTQSEVNEIQKMCDERNDSDITVEVIEL